MLSSNAAKLLALVAASFGLCEDPLSPRITTKAAQRKGQTIFTIRCGIISHVSCVHVCRKLSGLASEAKSSVAAFPVAIKPAQRKGIRFCNVRCKVMKNSSLYYVFRSLSNSAGEAKPCCFSNWLSGKEVPAGKGWYKQVCS